MKEEEADLELRESHLQKLIHSVFPKVRRWSSVTTLVSIPVALAGVAIGSPLFIISGSSLAGISHLSKEATKLLSNKYSWVSFRNKHVVMPDND